MPKLTATIILIIVALGSYAWGYWYEGQQQAIAQWDAIQAEYGPVVAHEIYLSIKR